MKIENGESVLSEKKINKWKIPTEQRWLGMQISLTKQLFKSKFSWSLAFKIVEIPASPLQTIYASYWAWSALLLVADLATFDKSGKWPNFSSTTRTANTSSWHVADFDIEALKNPASLIVTLGDLKSHNYLARSELGKLTGKSDCLCSCIWFPFDRRCSWRTNTFKQRSDRPPL